MRERQGQESALDWNKRGSDEGRTVFGQWNEKGRSGQ